METFDSTAASANNERVLSIDKLTKIDGIARKTAEVMYEIGIHSYAELASYLRQRTAEDVSLVLKEHGLNRPPGFIKMEAWTRQAEKFGQSEKTARTAPEEESKPTNKSEEVPSSRESRDHDAVFTVSFDVVRDKDGNPMLSTTVYDEKNAGKEEVFLGSEPLLWVNWMLARANLPQGIQQTGPEIKATEPPQTETKAVVTTVSAEPYDAQIEISDIQLSIIEPSSDVPEKILQAEISFQLSGTDAEALTAQGLPYRIEISTMVFGGGTPQLVASKDGQLKPHIFAYTHQLEFGMPTVGRYELHSLVRLPPSAKLIGYRQGPTMRIIP